jgi:hypothetical protein
MELDIRKLPYPVNYIVAYIRRRRSERWVRRWNRYRESNNVTPIHD